MFVSLSLIAFLLGPAGFDVPGTRLNGIFFSEWKFLNFIFMVAAPASIAAAALCWLVCTQEVECAIRIIQTMRPLPVWK